MAKPETVDDYLATLSDEARMVVEEVRRRVHALEPGLAEVIRYDLATFQRDGRSVLHVGGWAKHVSIYPVPHEPGLDELTAPYVAGRGTLKFLLGSPVPWDVVDRVLEALLRR